MTSLQDRLGNAIYLCAKREGEKSDLQTWGNCKKIIEIVQRGRGQLVDILLMG